MYPFEGSPVQAVAQFPMKNWGNRGKLFISSKTVEVKDHEGISGAQIFLCSYVFILESWWIVTIKLKVVLSSL